MFKFYFPILFLICFFLQSCASLPQPQVVDFEQNSVTPADGEKILSVADVYEDVSMIQVALERAYIGSRYLPSENFQELSANIQSIKSFGKMTTKDFCTHVGNAFQIALDNHLSVQINRERCSRKINSSSVGSNSGLQLKKAWVIQYRQIKKIRIPILSIHFFPSSDARDWDGYIESIRDLKKFKTIIVDLRDNGGGDDSKGYELADLLVGHPIDSAYKPSVDLNTIEALSIFKNMIIWSQKEIELQGGDGQQFNSVLEKLNKKIVSAKNRTLQKLKESDKEQSNNFKTAVPYRGNVYVLVNRKTASSGESTAEALRAIKNVKLVGENTAGYIHFGNKGQFQLPHSKLIVSMGTHFTPYKDGRFLEKIGISPDLIVPKGVDALDWLIENKY